MMTSGTNPTSSSDSNTASRTNQFEELIHQICAGSEDAIWELIETYGPHMQRYIRRKLNVQQRLRCRFDTVDFTQMVWSSFFRDHQAIASFDSPQDLTRYLCAVARNKFVSELRHSTAQRSGDIRRTESLDAMRECNTEPPAKDATPSHVVSTREQVTSLLGQDTERDRQIVEGRAAGKSFAEISHELGIAESTARRAIWRLVEQEEDAAAEPTAMI